MGAMTRGLLDKRAAQDKRAAPGQEGCPGPRTGQQADVQTSWLLEAMLLGWGQAPWLFLEEV